jgi:hypothetical protein
MSNDQSRVQLMTLYERTSAKGNRYLSGRLGAAKVVAFEDTKTEKTEGTSTVWTVYLSPGDDRARQGDDAGGARQARQRGGYAPGYAADPAQHPDRPADRGARSRAPAFDDEIPFAGRG